MKATLLKADGTREEITLPTENQLATLQGLVGGLIEYVPCTDPSKEMIVNEEHKFMDLPVNDQANALFLWHMGGDYICGDVVLIDARH